MFAKIAAFEFRYQIRSPVFWVGAFFFALISFGLIASANVSLGGGGAIHKNAPWALGIGCLAFSLWFMLITTAFVANVVVRDDETGFGAIVRSTPISKFSYLMGRFAGAYCAAALAFLSIPLGMVVGTLMPWVDQETIGPNRIADYAYAYFLLGLPSVLLTSALFFTVATVTRSMMWSYVGVIVFLVAYIVLNVVVGRKPEWESGAAFAEPFGTQAFAYVTKYWTVDEKNAGLPPFTGVLLANRLICLAVSLVLLAIGYNLYRSGTKGAKLRKHQRLQALAARAPAGASAAGPLPKPRFDGAAVRAQVWARTRFEMAQVFKSPAYFILLKIGLLFSFVTLFLGGEVYGVHAFPTTRNMVLALSQGLLGILIYVIATYYAGELVWRERDRKVHEIIGAAAVPDWAFIFPKMFALGLVMVSTVVASAAAGVVVQTLRGYTDYAFGDYLLWYILPFSADYILVAVLAIFLAAVSPHKFIGWGLMVVFIISTIVLSSLGFGDRLYHFGSGPNVPLSDMNGMGRYWKASLWFRAYWTAFSVLLAILSYCLWRRGAETRLTPQIKALPRRLRGPAGVVAGLALVAFVGLGSWIFYNTHVMNHYRSNLEGEKLQAAYEKDIYNVYKDTARPSVVAIKLDVDLRPHQPGMTTRGSYVIENRTGAPLSDIHVRMAPDSLIKSWVIDLPGSKLVKSPKRFEDDYKFRTYRLDMPMAPGERRTLGFTTVLEERGFSNGDGTTRIVDNGTFITNFEFAPILGIDRGGLLSDRTKRRKYGLPAELRPPTLEKDSPLVRSRNYLGAADWQMSDITIHTDADQTPIAPGYRVSDVTSGGRRTARFVTDTPVLGFFSVQSARYAQKLEHYNGVDLVVFYDPHHPYNVDRMMKALKLSLDYYQPNFSKFQFRQARVSEFPALGGALYAQSFPNIFPWSEGLGFTADVRDPEKIDYVTYVAAHEFGHQWWAYQIIGADMQGDTMLSETMAQYSALMVMERLYGPDHIRKFLKYELDSYLRGRGSEALEELPLSRVENQGYIHYRKGAVAMYLLKDQIGQEAVNRALRNLLAAYAFKSAPYPSTKELIPLLRAEAPADKQQLISDLFEKITLWDVKTTKMAVSKRKDGKFDVHVTVDAKKFYANGKGKETPTTMTNESFDIGLFARKPDDKAFGTRDVIRFERVPLSSGVHSFDFVTDKAPAWGGIDPYIKHIDRNSNDNLAAAS